MQSLLPSFRITPINIQERTLAKHRSQFGAYQQRLGVIDNDYHFHKTQDMMLYDTQEILQTQLSSLQRKIQQARQEIHHPHLSSLSFPPAPPPSPVLQQHHHQPPPKIPWPTRKNALTSIRKPKFLAALSQLLDTDDDDDAREIIFSTFNTLQAHANDIMDRVIATLQIVHRTGHITRTWHELPHQVQTMAINTLENDAQVDIHRAQDHWMAAYLLNEQCTPDKWARKSPLATAVERGQFTTPNIFAFQANQTQRQLAL